MDKVKKILSFLFVALFLSYYGGTIFFPHSHIIGETTVFHSHIHTDSHHDTNDGNHTDKSISFIAKNSHFDYTDFSGIYVPKQPQFPLCNGKFIETAHWVASIYFQNLSLRAPPHSLFGA